MQIVFIYFLYFKKKFTERCGEERRNRAKAGATDGKTGEQINCVNYTKFVHFQNESKQSVAKVQLQRAQPINGSSANGEFQN